MERNWAGNHTFTATRVHRPTSLDELRALIVRVPRLRAIGSGHSFNDIADSAEMVSLDQMGSSIDIDTSASMVTVSAQIRYGDLAKELERANLALHNMASLPHISVGGAVATATHGSGDRKGNLSTAVAAIELVTSDGDLHQFSRGDADFNGVVVGLGALGVVTRLTLDVQPTYQVQQLVFESLAWNVLNDQFDEIMGCADSVSLFLDYSDSISQLWCKTRVEPDRQWTPTDERFGARTATRNLHPVGSLPADSCTQQLGVPGAWLERLPHFRLDAVPASGDELQSEYMVPRSQALAALQAVRTLAAVLQPHLWISEIRSVAADELWMSPAYGTDTICIHFSWKNDMDPVNRLLPLLEQTLQPYGPRPHWGKIFLTPGEELRPRYARSTDFIQLMERLDPRGAFRNEFLVRHLIG